MDRYLAWIKDWFVSFYSEVRRTERQRALDRIRRESALLGTDLSQFSDRQIEDGVRAMAKAFQKLAVTVEEATKAFAQVFKNVDVRRLTNDIENLRKEKAEAETS